MTSGTLTLTPFVCPGGRDEASSHGHRYGYFDQCGQHVGWKAAERCRKDARDFKTIARTGKPLGYTWHLWHSQTGKKKRVPTHPFIHPFGVTGEPAYKRFARLDRNDSPAWKAPARPRKARTATPRRETHVSRRAA
jgi:hypothetical protein